MPANENHSNLQYVRIETVRSHLRPRGLWSLYWIFRNWPFYLLLPNACFISRLRYVNFQLYLTDGFAYYEEWQDVMKKADEDAKVLLRQYGDVLKTKADVRIPKFIFPVI